LLLTCSESYIIRDVVDRLRDRNSLEYNAFDTSFVDLPSVVNRDAILKAINGRYICPIDISGWVEEAKAERTLFVTTKLYSWLLNKFPGEVQSALDLKGEGRLEYLDVEEDSLMVDTINKVRAFFKECNYSIANNIKVVRFKNSRILGGTEGDTILVGINSIERGVQDTANTVREEYIHIKHGVEGETREFQRAAIDELITYMKRANAINL